MPQAHKVLTGVITQHWEATPAKLAERILDALHAEGFHLTEPSNYKAFGPTRGKEWDLYAAAAMGAILGAADLREASVATGKAGGLDAAESVAAVAAGQANAMIEVRNR